MSAQSDKREAVLCLHGFTGTPFEIAPLADKLAARGYLVSAPLLAGHGRDLAALEVTGWPDWLRSAEEAFDELAGRVGGARVAVVGFSMGGLLAMRLASARRERVAALVALSVPLRLRAIQVSAINLVGRIPRRWRRGPLRAIPKLFGSNVSDPRLRRTIPGLSSLPVSGLQSLLDLMATVRAELGGVTTSVLVAHGRMDRAVPISDSAELADRLDELTSADPTRDRPARVVQRLWLEGSRHMVGLDDDRELLGDAMVDFLRTHGRW